MYGTHTLAFQRTFVRMKIISLIFIRFSYVPLIRNSACGQGLKVGKIHGNASLITFIRIPYRPPEPYSKENKELFYVSQM
jgi:hypothetical protein